MKFFKNYDFWKQSIISVVIVVLISGTSFYTGLSIGRSRQNTVFIGGLSGNINPPEGINIGTNFNLFWQAWDIIQKEFIDAKELENKDLINGAIRGMVESAKDPYTVFFPPSEAKKFEEDIEGRFGGIGAEIGIRKEQLIVIAPLDGSPAQASGLRALDQILEINGTSTSGIDISEAVGLIRGEIGTEVKLSIYRKEWSRPKEIKITRALITVPTLKWELKPENILYIKLNSFNAQANRIFYQASLESLLKGVSGVVLDLRNNPGGFLEVAVDLGGWFLKRGDIVVTERFKTGQDKSFRANGNEVWSKIPMVILINGGTASASEILAGAIADHRGIKLIGEKTFGKGSVQTLKELSDGSTIKVTVAKWLLPSSRTIDKNGLEPDYKVEIKDTDIENNKDPQLEKALKVLKNLL